MTEMALSLMRSVAIRSSGFVSGILESYLSTNAMWYDFAFGGGKSGSIAIGRFNWKGAEYHPYIPRKKFLYSTIPIGQCVLLTLTTVLLMVVCLPLAIAMYIGDIPLIVVAVLLQWQVLTYGAIRAKRILTELRPTPYEREFVSGQTSAQVQGHSAPDRVLPDWWDAHVSYIVRAEQLRSLARKVLAWGGVSNLVFWMCIGAI